MLETSDRAIRLRSKNSIHREPFTRFARTELEFLLDAANRVARITLFHLNYQSRPRRGTTTPSAVMPLPV